ncbi:oxidoreductase, partial [Rhizophagus irregularis]
MRELLPQVGEIQEIKAHFSWLLEDEKDIRLNEQLGGGALYDVGCYCMHAITQIIGYKPKRIFMTSPQEKGVDETSHIIMYDENNTLASFTCSMRMPFENYYLVYGTKGILKVEHSFRPDLSPDGKGIVTLLDQNENILEQHHYYDEPYVKQIEYMEKCISQEASSDAMLQSSLEMAKYIEFAYRSRQKEVVAVCDSSIERSKKVAKQYQIPFYTDNINAILENEQIEAVVIVTSTSSHYEIITKAIDTNKAIFVEKPLTIELETSKKILAHANEKNAFVQVGFMR